jgi:hypothetical protein
MIEDVSGRAILVVVFEVSTGRGIGFAMICGTRARRAKSGMIL